MKKFLILLMLIIGWTNLSAQTLQPYTVGIETDKPIKEVINESVSKLTEQGFDVVGQYMPANDKNRWILVVTHGQLFEAVKAVDGLAGFAATLRVGITTEEGKTIVSYTTPNYWGNAYYRDNFPKVKEHYTKVTESFEKAMHAMGDYKGIGLVRKKALKLINFANTTICLVCLISTMLKN